MNTDLAPIELFALLWFRIGAEVKTTVSAQRDASIGTVTVRVGSSGATFDEEMIEEAGKDIGIERLVKELAAAWRRAAKARGNRKPGHPMTLSGQLRFTANVEDHKLTGFTASVVGP